MFKRLGCFFFGHQNGTLVLHRPTPEDIAEAKVRGASQLYTRAEFLCGRCGRDFTPRPGTKESEALLKQFHEALLKQFRVSSDR